MLLGHSNISYGIFGYQHVVYFASILGVALFPGWLNSALAE
jgi:hypothetical protein